MNLTALRLGPKNRTARQGILDELPAIMTSSILEQDFSNLLLPHAWGYFFATTKTANVADKAALALSTILRVWLPSVLNV